MKECLAWECHFTQKHLIKVKHYRNQVAAVCVTHRSLRLRLVHFNLTLVEYRSVQLFPLTYQWQPLQYDPPGPPTHTHSSTCHILSVCQHRRTHSLRDRQRCFPIHPHKPHYTHTTLQSSALCKRSSPVQNKPPLVHGMINSPQGKSLFLETPEDWQLMAKSLLEELLQAWWSGTNLSWAVWMRGQGAAEGPGAPQERCRRRGAFNRDLRASGSPAVPWTVQSQDWSYEESVQICTLYH